MNAPNNHSFILATPEDLPVHLQGRAPFTFPNVAVIYRAPQSQVVGPEGNILMAGALEFQTQITPGLLVDVCEPDEIYNVGMRSTHRFRSVYDPDIQRGIKDTKSGPKEFLRTNQIESMKEDIYENRFECPQLMWNLRAGEVIWVYVTSTQELYIYEGVGTRPDTNHRHWSIIGMHKQYLAWVRETGTTVMGSYNPDRAYGLVIYTDDEQQEAHRFYVYNYLGSQVSTSTAHYIESKTDGPKLHNRLARELMEDSGVLGHQNVEILSNHLSRNSAKMLTFGTLVEALKRAFPVVTDLEYEPLKTFLLEYLRVLGKIRPKEIGLLSVTQRQQIRSVSVADQAVMWHAYLRLAAELKSQPDWEDKLDLFDESFAYKDKAEPGHWSGDLFSRDNPAWSDHEVIASGKTGPRVVNNRQSREGAFEFLRDLLKV